jgi:hypothetical protein
MIVPAFKRCTPGTSRPVLRTGHAPPARLPGPSGLAPLILGAAWLTFSAAASAEGSLPQSLEHYLQYGVGFTTETVASPGAICPANANAPCVLGSGVGLALRMGYRTRGPFYVGGAYEFSRQDSSNLLRLGILQQLRGEARYYLLENTRLVPYLGLGVGGALYGNEWGSDTGGLTAFLGGGAEFEISRTTVVGAQIGYRPVVFRRWEDSAGQVRADDLFGFGVGHLVAGELVFEVRDPLPRW